MAHDLNQGVRNYRSVSFHVRENKRKLLEKHRKVAGKCWAIAKGLLLHETFSFSVFLSLSWMCRARLTCKFTSWLFGCGHWCCHRCSLAISREAGHTQLCGCKGEQSWGWTTSTQFLNSHKPEILVSSLPTLVSITHAIGLGCWEKRAKYNALGLKHRKIFILTVLIP